MKFVERCAQTKKKQLYLYKLDSKLEANCGAVYMKQIFQLNTACLRTFHGGTGWPAGYSLRGGVDLGTTSASGRKEGLNQGPPDYKSSEQITGHACLTRHAVDLFFLFAIQCSQKYCLSSSFSGYA